MPRIVLSNHPRAWLISLVTPQVSASGDGLSTAVVAVLATFSIDSRDIVAQTSCCCAASTCTGWLVHLQARTDGGRPKSCDECALTGAVSPRKPSSEQFSSVTYLASRKGVWSLSVYSTVNLIPVHVPGSPFTVSVLPAAMALSKTQTEGSGLVGCVLNVEAQIVVTTQDAYGNTRTELSLTDDVQVYLVGETAFAELVQKSATGIYAGKFAGKYCGCLGCSRFCSGCECVSQCQCQAGMATVNVLVDYQHVPGSPFLVQIIEQTGTAVARKSNMVNDWTIEAVAGELVEILVRGRDELGIDVTSGGAAVTAQAFRRQGSALDSVHAFALPVLDQQDGAYLVSFETTSASPHALLIELDGTPIFTAKNGTARSGTPSAISLGYDSEQTDNVYLGYSVYIFAGQGANQITSITDFRGVPRRATADFPFAAPDITSQYLLLPYKVVVYPAEMSPRHTLVRCGIATGLVASAMEDFTYEGALVSAGRLITDGAQCGLSAAMASSEVKALSFWS